MPGEILTSREDIFKKIMYEEFVEKTIRGESYKIDASDPRNNAWLDLNHDESQNENPKNIEGVLRKLNLFYDFNSFYILNDPKAKNTEFDPLREEAFLTGVSKDMIVFKNEKGDLDLGVHCFRSALNEFMTMGPNVKKGVFILNTGNHFVTVAIIKENENEHLVIIDDPVAGSAQENLKEFIKDEYNYFGLPQKLNFVLNNVQEQALKVDSNTCGVRAIVNSAFYMNQPCDVLLKWSKDESLKEKLFEGKISQNPVESLKNARKLEEKNNIPLIQPSEQNDTKRAYSSSMKVQSLKRQKVHQPLTTTKQSQNPLPDTKHSVRLPEIILQRYLKESKELEKLIDGVIHDEKGKFSKTVKNRLKELIHVKLNAILDYPAYKDRITDTDTQNYVDDYRAKKVESLLKLNDSLNHVNSLQDIKKACKEYRNDRINLRQAFSDNNKDNPFLKNKIPKMVRKISEFLPGKQRKHD